MFKVEIENTTDFANQLPLKEAESDAKDSKEEPKDNDAPASTQDQPIPEVETSQKDEDNPVEANSQEETKPVKQDKYWAKLKKERAEKAAMAEQLEQLYQEKLQMEQMLASAINTGSTHYKQNVAGELDMAQARLQLALENGDASAVAKATADISKATHALNEASKIAPLPEAKYSDDYVNQIRAKEYEDRLYSWLENNPEVDRNAPEYDEKTATQVLSFIQKLDRKYHTNGKDHLIGSSGYYHMIDDYIDNLKIQGSPSVNQPAKHFGAVRSRSPMESVPDRKPRELSEREKKAALAFGLTYEQYIAHLEKYNKEMRSKNGS